MPRANGGYGILAAMHTYRALDRLKNRAFHQWCALLAFGDTPEAEAARLRYNAFVDLSNAWTRPRGALTLA